MTSSLSNQVNNLSEEFISLNVNSDTMIKNVKLVELNIIIVALFSSIQTLKMN